MNKIFGALMMCFLISTAIGLFTGAEKEDYLYIFIGVVVIVAWVVISFSLILS